MTHICVGKLTTIGSDNGLSPDRRQAIIWTNAGILLIGPLGTNFSEILIEILTFSFKKMRLKVSSAKRRSSCRGLNVLWKLTKKPLAYPCNLWNIGLPKQPLTALVRFHSLDPNHHLYGLLQKGGDSRALREEHLKPTTLSICQLYR